MKKQNSKNYSSKAQSAQPDNTIFVFGHRNPDSDSICSSLVVADWLNATNRPAKPYRLGSLTPESRYILNSAGIAAPDLLDVDLTDKLVWLVDFTDIEQGPSSLINSNIIGIIDHHRIGTVITRNPPDVWVRAVGCCGTIILSIMMNESAMPPTPSQAILLMGAILSDTVALTSPTTTSKDREAIDILLQISGLDYQQFVSGLLRAKTDLAGQSPSELLLRDAKAYRIHNIPVLLSQIEVSDITDISPLLPSLQQEMGKIESSKEFEFVALIVTDITKANSTVYFTDSKFIGELQVYLPNMISRKKEILPWLTDLLTSSPNKR